MTAVNPARKIPIGFATRIAPTDLRAIIKPPSAFVKFPTIKAPIAIWRPFIALVVPVRVPENASVATSARISPALYPAIPATKTPISRAKSLTNRMIDAMEFPKAFIDSFADESPEVVSGKSSLIKGEKADPNSMERSLRVAIILSKSFELVPIMSLTATLTDPTSF